MKMKSILTALAVSIVMILATAGAQAATLRAFVSSSGSDANAGANCPQATPCRTFAGALPTVTAGGELIALDTAGYGPLTGANTINKSITIAAIPGQTAFVVAAAGTAAFTIAAAAGDTIILRNLNFNGSGAAGTTGIQHNSGRLLINNCKFAQLSTGLSVVNAKADVIDSEFTANALAVSASGTGWDINVPATPAVALITLQGGSIKFNATALNMTNPGAVGSPNIWIHSIAGYQPLMGIVQNATYMTSSGAGCPCNNPGWYQSILVAPK